jgi:hypothetical protein
MKTIAQIREDLARVYDGNEDHSSIGFVNDDTVELIGATFVADEPSIFGKVNEDYVQRVLWTYLELSRRFGKRMLLRTWKSIPTMVT